jgi:hypothetical protein
MNLPSIVDYCALYPDFVRLEDAGGFKLIFKENKAIIFNLIRSIEGH